MDIEKTAPDPEKTAPDPETDALRVFVHNDLLSRKCEGVEMASVQIRARGVAEPAVLVLDLNDPGARAIAETVAPGRRIADCVAGGARRGRMPVVTCGLSRSEASDLVDGQFPGMGAVIDAIEPEVGYPAVVVCLAAASAFAMPLIPGAGPPRRCPGPRPRPPRRRRR